MNELLREKNGQVSSVRAGMFICIITACYLAVAGLHVSSRMGENAASMLLSITGLVTIFLGAGFTAKVVQKGKENG